MGVIIKTDDYLKSICDAEGYDFIQSYTKKTPSGQSQRYMDITHRKCHKTYSCKVAKFTTENQRCTCERKSKYTRYSTLDEYNNILKEMYGDDYIALGTYLGSHKPITIKHSCGKIFTVSRAEMLVERSISCPDCKKGTSNYETELITYIKSFYNGIILRNWRDSEKNNRDDLEIDIYLPEIHLGIEIDGLYWHSTDYKPKKYHIDKTLHFANKGIRIIHIFEDEFVNKLHIVKDKIHSMIKKFDTVYYARKCQIFKPTNKECKEFLETNHIQGYSNSSNISYGLKYNDETVSILCLNEYSGRNSNKTTKYGNKVYELTRYATKLNTNVIGGFNKLLSQFELDYNYDSIISYGDIRYTDLTKNIYSTSGFIFDHYTEPSYFYIKGKNRYSKYGFRKATIKTKSNIVYDENKTEQQNMLDNGYKIIYDCGLITYIKKKK